MKKIASLKLGFILLMSLSINQQGMSQDLLAIPDVAPKDKICFALYTVDHNILKLTAQLYPLKNVEPWIARLELKQGDQWLEVDRKDIDYPGYTARFRVENFDNSKDVYYRVAHGKAAIYEGVIKKNPVDKNEIVVAGFTGNSIYPGTGGNIPKNDIVENLKKIQPDLLFFSGDQVYDHAEHLAYWLKFGRDFGDIIRNTPTITIPDDHDVGMYNLWGEEGAKSMSRAGADGGYYMPAEYVKEVERTQTSHLPDPYDPTPVKRGIGVYYTDLNIGGISFAILEDRKFKTGPDGVVPQMGPRPDHIAKPDYDPKDVDVAGAKLLGDRQLKFLHEWGQDWTGCCMKAVLSQTIFCGGAHVHGKAGGRVLADMDSNGWPQTGRNKALSEMRKSFAFHLAGDQHLATIFHHGIDEWNDAGFSFCVPSIANYYLRWWEPLTPGNNRIKGLPEYTGEHVDGFGNKINCYAVANPSKEPNGGKKLTTRAAGFGIVRFNKESREITMECWPRNTDVSQSPVGQYPGWPLTITQEDNYGRKAVAYLPKLIIEGKTDPVVQIIKESNDEIIYTLRIKGHTFRPKVFEEGLYTVKIFDNDFSKEIKNVESVGFKKKKMRVEL